MQPRTDLWTRSGTAGVDGRHRASPPSHRSYPTSSTLPAVLTDLSAIVCRVHGLQQLHDGEDELADHLRRTVDELESLIAGLLHADGSGPRPAPTPKASVDPPHASNIEEAFVSWLLEPTSADELRLSDGDGHEPLSPVLGELTASRRALPAVTAAGLGWPDGATVGHVAAELLIAVKDPAGPRCRSYRAALYYLRDLDRACSYTPGNGEVHR
jgi:hypothetical protein